MLLELLIPTMEHRQPLLARLFDRLLPQLVHLPHVTYRTDDGPGTIGEKRQRMIAEASADYTAFIDDDDLVAPDYVRRVLQALALRPDVVGMVVHVTMDGRPWQPSPLFHHSLRFRDNVEWNGQQRPPHHLCPMRRDIAVREPFPPISWAEDVEWSRRIIPHLKTESWSGDTPLYFYDYISNK